MTQVAFGVSVGGPVFADDVQELASRYARWRTFDPAQKNATVHCWLDRKTGRLVYQPTGVNPNVIESASQVFSHLPL